MTASISIINHTTHPGLSAWPSDISDLGPISTKATKAFIVDLGWVIETAFTIPQNYETSPTVVIEIAHGSAPSGTFGVGVQLLQAGDSDSLDTAYEAADTASNSDWTGIDTVERYRLSVPLTPDSGLTPGDLLLLKISDNGSDINYILVTDIRFEFSEIL